MDNQQNVKAGPRKIRIDGVEYDFGSLSDKTKSMIRTLRAADRELAQLEARVALVRIARQTIAANLQAELNAANPGAEKK